MNTETVAESTKWTTTVWNHYSFEHRTISNNQISPKKPEETKLTRWTILLKRHLKHDLKCYTLFVTIKKTKHVHAETKQQVGMTVLRDCMSSAYSWSLYIVLNSVLMNTVLVHTLTLLHIISHPSITLCLVNFCCEPMPHRVSILCVLYSAEGTCTYTHYWF